MGKLAVLARIGFFFALLLTGGRALRDVRINVPSAVVRGKDAVLECYYDLEGDQLYAVKWYLGTTEFYRYTPKEAPPTKQFPSQSGLKVREEESSATRVVLRHVPLSVSGRYSCEVSADAPSFFTSIQSAYLQVVDLPTYDPYITGVKTRYQHGDILRANCTSEHSYPPANLTWYVNGVPAQGSHVRNYLQKSSDGKFHTAHSVLRLKITDQSFAKQRLKIRCVARMYDIYYRSHEKSVEPEKKRHHHAYYAIVPTNASEPPLQWGLAQASGINTKTTLTFNNSPSSDKSAASLPTSSIVFVAVFALLR